MTKHRIVPAFLAIAVVATLAACTQADAPGEAVAATAEHVASSSSAGLPAGHADAGKQLASAKNAETGQACVDCHGADGNKPIDPTYPKLGGQYADYIEHALQAYREGDRTHALMGSQAKGLTDQQIADLGAYFASAPGELKDIAGAH